MTLDKLEPGMSGKITVVHGEGLLRRRLFYAVPPNGDAMVSREPLVCVDDEIGRAHV